jgi:hypothetical protein
MDYIGLEHVDKFVILVIDSAQLLMRTAKCISKPIDIKGYEMDLFVSLLDTLIQKR